MTDDLLKDDLLHYLQAARDALVWKLEGVSEYDARRPLVPTGTNLLGLVKHVASIESYYLGGVFGRPFGEPVPWIEEGAEPNADMWATAAESREGIVAFYQRVRRHSDETVRALPLDTVGEVWWWRPNGHISLHRMLVHLVAETDRHAGQADIVREIVDGSVGFMRENQILADLDDAGWSAHAARVEAAAVEAARLAGEA